VPKTCREDRECPAGTICEKSVCVKVKRPINIAYLFYLSGDRRYTSALFLYHHQRGASGFRVVAPFYFHVWSQRRDSHVVFPFFFRHRNLAKKVEDTFFLLFHSHRSPGKKAFNVWPLLFTSDYGKSGFQFTVFPLLHYGRRDRTWSAYSVLALPWFVRRSPGKTLFGVLPFTVGSVSRQRTFVWTLPLNFYHRRGTDQRSWVFLPLYAGSTTGPRHTSWIFPFFVYHRNGQDKTRFVSPLALYGHSRSEGWRYFFLTAPPMFFSRDRSRSVSVVFPFYLGYRSHDHRSALHVVPPFVYYRDPRQTNAALLPIFYYFRDERTRSYTTLLLPLFYGHRTPAGDRVSVFGPLYVATKKRAWAGGVFPLLHVGTGPGRGHAVLFPLLWHHHRKATGTSFTQALNFYFARTGKQWSAGLMPLLFLGGGPRGNHQVVFPLFFRRHDKVRDRSFTVAGPFVHFRNRGDWGHGLVPFYWFERSYARTGHVRSTLFVLPLLYQQNDRRHFLVATPLGGYRHDKVRSTRTLVAGPFFKHTAPGRSMVGLLPFYAQDRRPAEGQTTRFVFPLFLSRSDRQSTTATFFPLVWYHRSPRQRTVVVYPLFWHFEQRGGRQTDLLFPLFFRHVSPGSRTYAVGPAFWHRRGERTALGLFPIFHLDRTKRRTWGHLFPLVFHYRNDLTGSGATVALPFYDVRRRDSRHSGVLPLAFWGRSGSKRYAVGFPLVWSFGDRDARKNTTFLGPLFYHRRGRETGGGLFPLVWIKRDPAGLRQLSLFPLVHVSRRSDRLTVASPLFGFGWDRALRQSWGYAGPVFWQQGPRRSAQVVFPLFWRFHRPEEKITTTVAFPLYFGRSEPESRFDVVFPLVWHQRTITSRSVLVLPFVYDRVDHHEARTTAVFPLFYRRRVHHLAQTTWVFPPSLYVKQRPGQTDVVLFPVVWHFGSKTRSTSVGFPLWWDFRRPGKRVSVFFPFVWRFDNPQRTHLVVLNSYYRYEKSNRTYAYHFFPVFSVARKRPGDFRFDILGGLFGYERIGRNRDLKLFFGRIKLPTLKAAPAPAAPPPATRPAAAASLGPAYFPF
jgi:hypothetical protein